MLAWDSSATNTRRLKLSAKKLKQIEWYVDPAALARREPGIRHSFMASLATALNYVQGELNPAWLMGSSAFAFRIFINETMCPSAMSVFDYSAILPEAVEQAGYRCRYISRYWDEDEVEEMRRKEAQAAIFSAINRGVPAIVWDIFDDEWGLIIGYDEEKRSYDTLTIEGKPGSLAFEKLGHNGIDILSVTIPEERNQRSRTEIISKSLKTALAHAAQKEWFERPNYQDGLPAFDLWALVFERWAMLLEAGKSGKIDDGLRGFANYYAAHHFSARCYARDYLKALSEKNESLNQAWLAYAEVASLSLIHI